MGRGEPGRRLNERFHDVESISAVTLANARYGARDTMNTHPRDPDGQRDRKGSRALAQGRLAKNRKRCPKCCPASFD